MTILEPLAVFSKVRIPYADPPERRPSSEIGRFARVWNFGNSRRHRRLVGRGGPAVSSVPARGEPKAIKQDGQSSTVALEAEIANLKKQAELLRSQFDDMTRNRYRWAAQVSQALLTSSSAARRLWQRLAG